MTNELTARHINTLARFCGRRDVPELTSANLQSRFGFQRADVMVLFGGSILFGGDVLAQAMRGGIAKKYVIVGGEGHTTETLRLKMRQSYPQLQTERLAEAQIFAAYLKLKYDLVPDYLECESTNCGNNITYLLRLLEQNQVNYHSILLSQDATMQLRMDAGMRKYCPPRTVIINYAAYAAAMTIKEGRLAYAKDIWGMWDIERYISLLLGEIPRLRDDAEGYGPKGKQYIAHMDIPQSIQRAFDALKSNKEGLVRTANPLYVTKN